MLLEEQIARNLQNEDTESRYIPKSVRRRPCLMIVATSRQSILFVLIVFGKSAK